MFELVVAVGFGLVAVGVLWLGVVVPWWENRHR